ncbi:hypothetical protein [Cohaesibacter intestini]|uniref:hypothetical protein n=1 Tax=Cohaesibacter intestini TaxID=2211145 RepID=UPI000DE8D0BC|nr:hypothetical protein [Cohaesibacter intestini]
MAQIAENSFKPNKPVGIFWGYLLVAVSTALALVALLFWFFATFMVDLSFLSDAACRKVSETRFYDSFTYCFYGSDWDEESYLSAISGFYSTLVAVLVAVQALISWLAFTVIRSSNKQAIGEEVEREVPYFFKTKDADRLMREALNDISYQAAKEALSNLRKDDDKSTEELQQVVYDNLQPALEGIQGEIEELRVRLDSLNDGYDDGSEEQEGKISQ